MKKLLIVLAALVMGLQLTVCSAEEEKNVTPFGMPNPVVEYGSLEEINTLTGVRLIRPSIVGVTNERYFIINNTVAQYICEINGMEWTFRSAYVTNEDISGIYHEYNTFSPYQNFGLVSNEFYLERFFDGDRQYTVAVKDPISEDGEVFLQQEIFMDICMELESIQKQHLDDPLVGDYQDRANKTVTACIERHGDVYLIGMNRSVSDLILDCWNMYDAVLEDGRLSYQGEEICRYTFDEEGNEISSEVTVSDHPGCFEIKDGMLYWTGAAQEECRAWVFKKIVYEE